MQVTLNTMYDAAALSENIIANVNKLYDYCETLHSGWEAVMSNFESHTGNAMSEAFDAAFFTLDLTIARAKQHVRKGHLAAAAQCFADIKDRLQRASDALGECKYEN